VHRFWILSNTLVLKPETPFYYKKFYSIDSTNLTTKCCFLQATEPPEPEHVRPKAEDRAATPPIDNSNPDDPSKHEDGEVKVGQKWEFPVAITKKGMLWGNIEESR
jgi:hypothetical protein